MLRLISLTLALALPLSACAPAQPGTPPAPELPADVLAACPVTASVFDTPPEDPNADPFGPGPWFINADRSIWLPADSYSFSVGENKFGWIRPTGESGAITGRRLDGDAPPISYFSPGGYFTGFEVGALTIPTAGCWEVTATAGVHALVIVVAVPGALPQQHPAVRAARH